MKNKFTFIDLFAGIGGFRIAFENAGGKCVFSSEINKFAVHTYSANYLEEEIHWKDIEKINDHPEMFGDIRKINKKEIPSFDILAAGFPCPTFSIAGVSKRNSLGLKHGLEDKEKGQLFFQIRDVLEAKKPKAFLLENVKNLLSHNSGKTFEFIKSELEKNYNVTFKVFDAAKLVPQHRERVLIAGFRKDLNINFNIKTIKIEDKNPKLKDILLSHDEVDEKYTISNRLWEYLQDYKKKHKKKGNGFGYSIADPEGVTRTMSARYHKDGSEILIAQPGKNPRMLTELEAARLFGFDTEYRKVYGKDFIIPVSRTQAYQQFGNSVCVPLIRIVANHMVQALENLQVNDEVAVAL